MPIQHSCYTSVVVNELFSALHPVD